jgi:hypothetical protein
MPPNAMYNPEKLRMVNLSLSIGREREGIHRDGMAAAKTDHEHFLSQR